MKEALPSASSVRGGLADRRVRVLKSGILAAIALLGLPSTMSRLLNVAFYIVDTLVLGVIGSDALAVIGVVGPLFMVLTSPALLVSSYTTAVVSQLVGAGRYGYLARTGGMILGASLILGSLSALLMVIVAPIAYQLQGVPESVLDDSLAYTYSIAPGIPGLFLAYFFINSMTASGDAKTPLKLNAAAAAINTVLTPILGLGLLGAPSLGVIGVGLSSSISRIVVALYALIYLWRGGLGVVIRPLTPSASLARKMIAVGSPVALNNLALGAGLIVFVSIVSSLGPTVLAAYSLSLRLIEVLQEVSYGLNQAISTIVGQRLGAGMTRSARDAALEGSFMIYTSIAALSVLIYLASKHCIAALSAGDIVMEAIRMIEIVIIGAPFLGLIHAATAVSRGSGHTAIPSLIGVARIWLLRIPLAVVLAGHYGSTGIWLSITVSNIVSGVASMAWILLYPWTKSDVISKRGGLTSSPP